VFLKELDVPAGTTIIGAIEASGLTQACPEVDPSTLRVGVYGKLKTLDTPVRQGDRVEVHRVLTADPKTARRKRVQRTRRPARARARNGCVEAGRAPKRRYQNDSGVVARPCRTTCTVCGRAPGQNRFASFDSASKWLVWRMSGG
jgi:putative ubiquitin-RnfH superfamily antitoxin RatB of RatAB toxin-antitoxin module